MKTRFHGMSDRCAAVIAGARPSSALGNTPEWEFAMVNEWLMAIYEVVADPRSDADLKDRVITHAYAMLESRVSPAYQLNFHDKLCEELDFRTKAMRDFFVKDMAL